MNWRGTRKFTCELVSSEQGSLVHRSTTKEYFYELTRNWEGYLWTCEHYKRKLWWIVDEPVSLPVHQKKFTCTTDEYFYELTRIRKICMYGSLLAVKTVTQIISLQLFLHFAIEKNIPREEARQRCSVSWSSVHNGKLTYFSSSMRASGLVQF